MTRGMFKEKLLDSLTEREAAGFVELLSKMKRPFGDDRAFLMSVDTKELFGILHHKLFGSWDFSSIGFCKVLENLDEVKQVLGEIPLSRALVENSHEPPGIPNGFQIENKEAGKVVVTIHAWKRFYERYCSRGLRQEEIIARLQRSFASAKQVSLGGPYEVLRAIKNEFAPARYFLDRRINCRFVVYSQGGRSCLLTVERPFPQNHRKSLWKRK